MDSEWQIHLTSVAVYLVAAQALAELDPEDVLVLPGDVRAKRILVASCLEQHASEARRVHASDAGESKRTQHASQLTDDVELDLSDAAFESTDGSECTQQAEPRECKPADDAAKPDTQPPIVIRRRSSVQFQPLFPSKP